MYAADQNELVAAVGRHMDKARSSHGWTTATTAVSCCAALSGTPKIPIIDAEVSRYALCLFALAVWTIGSFLLVDAFHRLKTLLLVIDHEFLDRALTRIAVDSWSANPFSAGQLTPIADRWPDFGAVVFACMYGFNAGLLLGVAWVTPQISYLAVFVAVLLNWAFVMNAIHWVFICAVNLSRTTGGESLFDWRSSDFWNSGLRLGIAVFVGFFIGSLVAGALGGVLPVIDA